MTDPHAPPIRRRSDGSIDIAHHSARGLDQRSAAIRLALRQLCTRLRPTPSHDTAPRPAKAQPRPG